jgi:hypothetical protein
LEVRLAIKKVALSVDFLEVKYEIKIRIKKYPIINESKTSGDINNIWKDKNEN